jgi:hypothetical protein
VEKKTSISHCNTLEYQNDLTEEERTVCEIFGLVDECPPFSGLWHWVPFLYVQYKNSLILIFIFKITQVAGGSLTASRLLIKANKPSLKRYRLTETNSLLPLPKQGAHTVFHWLGGRHRMS